MLDQHKIGNRIALFRREKGLTGERFAELLGVSPQAVSKWENGKCLPETSLLPEVARILGTSIDSLLMPQELIVLSAVYSDGVKHLDVTETVRLHVRDNRLHVLAGAQQLGVALDSPRLGILTVKYQTPGGAYYAYAVQDQPLTAGVDDAGLQTKQPFEVVEAYYGNAQAYQSAMTKMRHYDYFRWQEIHVDHERFPSSPGVDEPEFLTLIYLNGKGIHVISCQENETLCYAPDRTELCLKDTSARVLPGIPPLQWEAGQDCTWAGAMHAALRYMGEHYSYEQIMGMSGACYRLAFTDVWDWSATDALVAFDYSSILFRAIGYEPVWAARLEKDDRGLERKRIVADIDNGKPVLAINLRIAPEWGLITGYRESGKAFYCRTYFDREYLNEAGDYLESDFWPFLITHFGERTEKPGETDILNASLRALVDSFEAPSARGYHQGAQAYERWMEGLGSAALWSAAASQADVERRAGVNDALLLNMIDARRCAAAYLGESASLLAGEGAQVLCDAAAIYGDIAGKLADLRGRLKAGEGAAVHYNDISTKAISANLRAEQIALLGAALQAEGQIVQRVKALLNAGL